MTELREKRGLSFFNSQEDDDSFVRFQEIDSTGDHSIDNVSAHPDGVSDDHYFSSKVGAEKDQDTIYEGGFDKPESNQPKKPEPIDCKEFKHKSTKVDGDSDADVDKDDQKESVYYKTETFDLSENQKILKKSSKELYDHFVANEEQYPCAHKHNFGIGIIEESRLVKNGKYFFNQEYPSTTDFIFHGDKRLLVSKYVPEKNTSQKQNGQALSIINYENGEELQNILLTDNQGEVYCAVRNLWQQVQQNIYYFKIEKKQVTADKKTTTQTDITQFRYNILTDETSVNLEQQYYNQEVEIKTQNKTTVRQMNDVTAVVFIENKAKKINDQYVALIFFKQQKQKANAQADDTKVETDQSDGQNFSTEYNDQYIDVFEESDSGEDDVSENNSSDNGDNELDYVDNEELIVSIRPTNDVNTALFNIDLKSQFIKQDVHQDLEIKEIEMPSENYQMFLFKIISNDQTKMLLYYHPAEPWIVYYHGAAPGEREPDFHKIECKNRVEADQEYEALKSGVSRILNHQGQVVDTKTTSQGWTDKLTAYAKEDRKKMTGLLWKCISSKDFKLKTTLEKKLDEIENLLEKDKSKILDIIEQEKKIVDMKIYQTNQDTQKIQLLEEITFSKPDKKFDEAKIQFIKDKLVSPKNVTIIDDQDKMKITVFYDSGDYDESTQMITSHQEHQYEKSPIIQKMISYKKSRDQIFKNKLKKKFDKAQEPYCPLVGDKGGDYTVKVTNNGENFSLQAFKGKEEVGKCLELVHALKNDNPDIDLNYQNCSFSSQRSGCMNPQQFTANFLIIRSWKTGPFHTALEYKVTWKEGHDGFVEWNIGDQELIGDWIIEGDLPEGDVLQPLFYCPSSGGTGKSVLNTTQSFVENDATETNEIFIEIRNADQKEQDGADDDQEEKKESDFFVIKKTIINTEPQADDDQHIESELKYVSTKKCDFTFSMNKYKDEMIDNFKKEGFRDRDRLDVSLMLHETVLNMRPNRNVGEWLLKEEGTILQPMQELNGQCSAFLLLGNPQELKKHLDQLEALKGETNKIKVVKQRFEGCNYILPFSDNHLVMFQQNDFSFDFKQKSLADLCIEVEQISSLDIIIDYIQKFTSTQNFKLIQCIIPKIMQMEQPTMSIKPLWLCNNDDDDLKIKYFDKPDTDYVKTLPAHYSKDEYTITFNDRCKLDEHGQKIKIREQIFNQLRDDEKKEKASGEDLDKDGEIFIQDYFTYNARECLLQTEESKAQYIDDYTFSEMISKYTVSYPEDIEFCEKIQVIIDYKFNNKTMKYFKREIFVYLILFVIPFFIQVFGGLEGNWARGFLIITWIGQLVLFVIEVMQAKIQGKEYLKSYWNIQEQVMFGLYQVYFFMRIGNPKTTLIFDVDKSEFTNGTFRSDPYDEFLVILNVLIVVQIMTKVLFYQKIQPTFGLLSTLIIQVVIGFLPFFGLYLFWVTFFSVISVILGANRSNAEGFTGTNIVVGYFLQTFENSIGNINAPSVEFLSQPKHDERDLKGIIAYLIYAFWFLGQVLLLIVMLNFVIALISQYYESVMNSKVQHTYAMRQELNQQCDIFYEFLRRYVRSNTNLKVDSVVLIDGDNRKEDSEWAGLSQTMKIYIDKHVVTAVEASRNEVRSIKKEAKDLNDKVETQIDDVKKEVQDQSKKVKTEIEVVTSKIELVKTQIDDVKTDMMNVTKLKCSNGHVMKWTKTPPYAESHGTDGVECDKCRRSLNVPNGFFHCGQGQCTSDVCQDCADQNKAVIDEIKQEMKITKDEVSELSNQMKQQKNEIKDQFNTVINLIKKMNENQAEPRKSVKSNESRKSVKSNEQRKSVKSEQSEEQDDVVSDY